MKRWLCMALCAGFIFTSAAPAAAHFGMLIPGDAMVMADETRSITFTLSFSHPFERVGMPLVKPQAVTVTVDGRTRNLLDILKPAEVMGQPAYRLDFTFERPGAYIFVMTPTPYWEPAEDCFIIHYTKTVVAAFGDDEGWDAEVGLKTEIVPLSKPFGLYAGNVFQGIVKLDGRPVPYAEVEVEYDNRDGKALAPSDYMVTQTIKADGNGVFTYATPRDGWWGFAALNGADFKIQHEGVDKDVELGAVLWVHFEKWREK